MKLQRISLANFRGFEQIDLEFLPDLTVIAGVNGVGKSGLLNALASAMSFALRRITVSAETSLSLIDTDVQAGKTGLSLAAAIKLDGADVYVDYARTAPLEKEKAETLTRRRDELRFARRETEKGSKEELEILEDIRRIELLLVTVSDVLTVRVLPSDPALTEEEYLATRKSCNSQPLAVFYSTARFLSRLPPVLPKTKPMEVATAYERALSQLEVSLNDFANWYRVIAEREPSEGTDRLLQLLEAAVRAFLPGVSGLQLHADRPPRFTIDKDGRRLYLEQLSDGERGLLALVFDLTRRLAIANPDSENPIAEGVALVLIDEIELHLHPKWQRDVMRLLPAIFKSCQFVITTHSPQVIGEVEARCVRLLSFKAGKVVSETPGMAYGADSNWILNVLMGADEMNENVEKEIESIARLISDRKLQDAKEKVAGLRECVGNTTAIQKIVSTLERIERLGR